MFLSTDPKRCSKLAPGITRSRTSRKGVDVDTLDIDPELKPTYLADIREPFTLPRRYDVVLASRGARAHAYRDAIESARRLRALGDVLVISVPYTTVRFFTRRPDYGRIVSCEGQLHTGIPVRWWEVVRWPVRAIVRLARGDGAAVFAPPGMPIHPPDPKDVSVHHWDAAGRPIRGIRDDFRRLGGVSVRVHRDTNCAFFTIT